MYTLEGFHADAYVLSSCYMVPNPLYILYTHVSTDLHIHIHHIHDDYDEILLCNSTSKGASPAPMKRKSFDHRYAAVSAENNNNNSVAGYDISYLVKE